MCGLAAFAWSSYFRQLELEPLAHIVGTVEEFHCGEKKMDRLKIIRLVGNDDVFRISHNPKDCEYLISKVVRGKSIEIMNHDLYGVIQISMDGNTIYSYVDWKQNIRLGAIVLSALAMFFVSVQALPFLVSKRKRKRRAGRARKT